MMYCNECEKQKLTINKLQIDVNNAINHELIIENKLKEELAILQNKLCDTELLILERENQLSKKEDDLKNALKQIKSYEDNMKESTLTKQKLIELQDELDVIRSQAEKAENAERQLERLREKLDDFNGIKQQLRKEVEVSAETHTKLLAAEQELEHLRKLKGQVETYRAQHSEYVILIEELTFRLQQKDSDIARLMENVDNLNDGQQGQLMQSKHLLEELQAKSEQIREINRSNGIGEGVSELNPELMQELERLRAQNSSLLSKIDETSVEALDKLEKDLADQKSIVTSLQSKWLSTKESLAAAMITITNLNSKVLKLENNLFSLQKEVEVSNQMAEEDKLAQKIENKRKFDSLSKNHSDAQHLFMTGQLAVQMEMSNYNDNLCQTIEEKCSSITNLENLNSNLQKSLDESIEAYESEKKKRKVDKEGFDATIEDIKLEHSQLLAMEMERSRSLAANVEEEKIKRRRIEREKKFYEAESNRHKTQLQTAGSGNCSEVESALKEIKTMQQQLDAANQEILELRSNNYNTNNNDNNNNNNSNGSTSDNNTNTNRRLASSRPVRVKVNNDTTQQNTTSKVTSSNSNTNGGYYNEGFLEQSEITDKRIEQLVRERRYHHHHHYHHHYYYHYYYHHYHHYHYEGK